MSNVKRSIVSILIMVSISLLMIFYSQFSTLTGIMKILIYELSIFALAILCIIVVKKIKGGLNTTLLGNIGAKSSKITFLLIKEGSSWVANGLSLLIFISAGLLYFMITGMNQLELAFIPSLLINNIHWIVLFAFCNAVAEEVFYRFLPAEIIGLNTSYIFISAVVFGIAHILGNPGGIVGVLMSTLLGFVLAVSVKDSKGYFWALLIHFVQDIIIFSLLFSYGQI